MYRVSQMLRGWLRPAVMIAVLLVFWQIAVSGHSIHLLPGPMEVVGGIADLVRQGLLLKYAVASLFGGWQFNLIATHNSPTPFTVTIRPTSRCSPIARPSPVTRRAVPI